VRVHELAKELGVASKDLVAALEAMGIEGRTASSSVPDEAVPRLRASGGKTVPGARPKEVVEAPTPKPKPKPKAKPKAEGEVEPGVSAGAGAPADSARLAAAKPAAATAKGVAARGAGPASAPAASATAVAPAPAPSPAAAPAPAAPAPATPVAAKLEPSKPALPSLKLVRGSTAQAIADKTGLTAADIVKTLFTMGEMVTATQSLSVEAISLLAAELGYEAEIIGVDEEEEEREEEVDESRLKPRPPVVTVMGHVDHGKTLLLDAIRKTDVVSQEFGGITQHIGAYQVHVNGREITFIDTPGHEAFTAMRARGAQVTDIAVLVVAADDGVKPQTVEALDHAKAAGVPIIVAVNKIDKPESDTQRVRQQMVERGVVPAEWGGTFEFVDVSAKARTNLESLLETVLLVADLEELKADPEGRARGTVLEAHLDKGRGPVASVLVQRGTLDVGDSLVCGTTWAKIRAMLDENGKAVKRAGPSKPAMSSARSRTTGRVATSRRSGRRRFAPRRWSRHARPRSPTSWRRRAMPRFRSST